MDLHDRIMTAVDQIEQPDGRPFVTVGYAQSLDGSIAIRRGERTQISGPESACLTHQLRANHDAILIGIGTVLADDPLLTVRLVEGENPQPVILDSKLRIPIKSTLVQNNSPWIATTKKADKRNADALSSHGAKLFVLPANLNGQIQLPALMSDLHRMGIKRLLVEGGAEVIASFLYAQPVDFIVVTISPMILGGLPAVHFPSSPGAWPARRVDNLIVEYSGDDLVVFGRPQRDITKAI